MRIDAHQHFWSLARGDYSWLTPNLEVLYRDFSPTDLAPLLATHGIDGTVLVQAAPSIAETHYLLGLAEQNSFIKGVVGWVDFDSSSAIDDVAELAAHPKLVGLRPMIQDIKDTDWLLGENLTHVFEAMISNELVFDALTLPKHLPNLLKLLARHPELCTVVDHGSKPEIASRSFDAWATDMRSIAAESNACVKLSGLVTEAKEDWTTNDLKPYVDHLIQSFGPARIIWGSDWPVCTLASEYHEWVDATDFLLSKLTTDERSDILGGNAARVYSLQEG